MNSFTLMTKDYFTLNSKQNIEHIGGAQEEVAKVALLDIISNLTREEK